MKNDEFDNKKAKSDQKIKIENENDNLSWKSNFRKVSFKKDVMIDSGGKG